MDKKIIRIENTNNHLYVYWIMTDFCNNACSYCSPHLHNGEFHNNPKFTREDAINFAHKLTKIAVKTNKKLFLALAGGEPTLYEPLPEILEILKPHSLIEILTNGSRNVSWWESLSALPDKVIISLHPEYYDKKKLRINELAKFLVDHNILLQFNLMPHPDMWDICMGIIEDIEEQYRPLIIPKLIAEQNTIDKLLYPYTKKQLNFIKSYKTKASRILGMTPIYAHYSDGSSESIHGNSIMVRNQHYFRGWHCGVGVNSIAVATSGDIYAGICHEKHLGNLKDFTMLEDYLICSRLACVCPGDISVSKYKS
jgi:MoaA/NifB/PqqE/SkfB family radical SAM enzyme